MKITSWGMIFTQLIMPLLIPANSIARENAYENMEDTLLGLQSVVAENDPPVSSPSLPLLPKETQREQAAQSTSAFPAPPPPEGENAALGSMPALPSLGSDALSPPSVTAPADALTGSAMQAAQILSAGNTTDASIRYAKSVGEGLINQQINDWLNQKGTARVSVGSDQKMSGDFLLPLLVDTDNLFFTQLGVHSNEDRDTVNAGVGYRQYVGDWMYGVNSFYDYDYTGKNARLGLGGEAWTDYLKLAVNGYYGLTDWHQSRVSAMKDYDERPANGFDLRADAYLPSYPLLGANLKYEQYFGKGIALGAGTQPDDLKDNPKALTFGLNYTPMPLLTLKGEHSVGDKDDSRIGIDVTYRFGVPWAQQSSVDSVDALRSLMGSMYEFVDRNYDIVMQYRKQDLLRIALPDTVTARAAEIITLPLTVSKAKYGLKDVEWTASAEFFANGGALRERSLTELEVTLPPYVYTKRANVPQQYLIKAVGIDNNGNHSNTAATTLNVEPSKNIISELAITPTGSVPANDADYFTVTASVLDEQGQPMAAQPLKFDIANLKGEDGHSAATIFKGGSANSEILTVNTDSLGKATVYVRSKLAKQGLVTATMNNGNYKSGQLDFIADATTAQISALDILKNKALADGKSTNELQATVKDSNGNPLANAQVASSATDDASLVKGSSVMTDAEGHAVLLVTHVRVSDPTITAQINGSAKNQVVSFVADKSTSVINQSDITATQDAIANGTDTNLVTVRVTDVNANAVPDVNLRFTVSQGANVIVVRGVTDNDGIGMARITSTRAQTYTVTAQVIESGNSAQTATRFIADGATATITEGNLVINPNGALANGVDPDVVEAVVTDANGNTVPNANVNFAVATGAVLQTLVGTTGEDGKARATVTSETATSYPVTATVNGHAVSQNARFVADSGTATITGGHLRTTQDNAVANGMAMNTVEATVTDGNGNAVPNVSVHFTATNNAKVATEYATTDERGIATTDLTNLSAGQSTVTAEINGNSQTVISTFMPDAGTAGVKTLTVIRTNALANGTATNEALATVTDAGGNPLSGIEVVWTVSGSAVKGIPAPTNANGETRLTFTDVKAEAVTVTAEVGDSRESRDSDFVADPSTAVVKTLTATSGAVANGEATNAATATVTDANDNVLSGQTVRWTIASNSGQAQLKAGSTVTSPSGETGVEFIDLTANETVTVTATLGNGASDNVTSSFVADASTAVVKTLIAVRNDAVADGSQNNRDIATVTDANGNVLSGVHVTWSIESTSHHAEILQSDATTSTQGEASVDFTDITAELVTVTASLDDGADKTLTSSFAADVPDEASSVLNAEPATIPADNATTSLLRLTLKDAHDNPVTGLQQGVAFKVSGQPAVTQGVTVGDITEDPSAPGVYEATLKGNKEGAVNIVPTVGGVRFSTLSLEVVLTVSWTSLTVSPDEDFVLNGDSMQYRATAVENGTTLDVTGRVVWSSADPHVATINSAGIATGVNDGVVSIIATRDGYTDDARLNVVTPTLSEIFGRRWGTADERTRLYQVKPGSTDALAFRCGEIVDAMGTTNQGVTGGSGGNYSTASLDNVTSIDVEWGVYASSPGGVSISKLRLNYSNGATYTCGQSGSTSNIQRGTWIVPDGLKFNGFYIYAGAYTHEMQFTAIPRS